MKNYHTFRGVFVRIRAFPTRIPSPIQRFWAFSLNLKIIMNKCFAPKGGKTARRLDNSPYLW